MDDLLERAAEVPALSACIAAVREGNGRLVIIAGEAGIGKTRLLAAADELARESGLRVLRARGSELEGEYAYGIVRQLLEQPVARTPELLEGGAALAAPVIDPPARGDVAVEDTDLSFARLRALQLICARLAERQPTLLAVDDAHWADPASLRFLIFAARRLGNLAFGLVLTMRPAGGERRQALLEALLEEPEAVHLRPRALTRDGVGRLVALRRGGSADERFVAACHEVTSGNPFLLGQLLREADDLGLPATAEGAARIRTLGPESIARTVIGRLRRTNAATTDAARWFAVLGEGARLDLVAELAGLAPAEARAAGDALYRAGVLGDDDAGRLRFLHPVVRSAIYGDVPPAERARRHARAGKVLAARGESLERIAAHVLAGEPASDPENVATLRAAAAQALSIGAPDAAVAYLRRALSEPPQDRAQVLRELARAEARVGDPATADHLLAAYDESSDVEFRVETAIELAASLMAVDRYTTVAARVWELADELVDERPDLAIRIEAALLTTARFAPPFADVLERRGDRVRHLLADPSHDGTVAQRTLLAGLAFDAALRAQPASETIELAERALEGGVLPSDMGRSVAFGMAVHALALSDALESAERHLTWALDRCRPRGSASGVAWASFFRAFVRLRIGRLAEAETDVLVAIETAQVAELEGWMGAALAFLIEIRLERGDRDGAREAYERLVARSPSADVPIVATSMLRGEGLMLLADGDGPRAAAAFERIGRIDATWGVTNSAGWTQWRGGAALARGPRDPAAAEFAAQEVAQARMIGLPRALSAALRVQDAVGGPTDLEEALAAAGTGPSVLERAHATVALGAARRRAGERVVARELLTDGLDLAERCGAGRLASLARDELVAAGARPRRASTTGRDALTPSEQRVALLAVDGRSNAEIADELVVTRKTVEMHLGRVYRKLGIGSRAQLAAVLRG
ncbi:AAA family ATPase [Solirubrobacter sp. CPCC 204708]|nr:AAA family ATPase [Solirubrobacter deserti]